MRRYFVQNFGCRATQADGAALERDLSSRGMTSVGDAAQADIVVLNTCTVTAAADEDARHAIRRVHRDNPNARILVTGCYAQRAPGEIAAIPGVDWVVGNSHKQQIGEIVAPDFVPLSSLCALEAARSASAPLAQIITGDIYAHTELLAAPVFGAGAERTRPNIKVQDGCNNKCSFCIIPSVRGRSRSLPASTVLRQVQELQRAGYREIVLSGINLGRWGRDLANCHDAADQRAPACLPASGFVSATNLQADNPTGHVSRPNLAQLLRLLLAESRIERIRLSSVEPMDFTDELLELMASSPRVARHVHAPLQSGADTVLRRMYRRYRSRAYEARIRRAHGLMPDAAFGADVMVGFPGETDEEFEQTRALIERLPFTYLHVFTFSKREGTVAARMEGQVNGRIARDRNRILRELVARKNGEFRRRQIGRKLSVITLADGTALSDNYLKVAISGEAQPANRILEVTITGMTEDGLAATRS